MSRAAHSKLFGVLLGLGAADLALLNLWLLPHALQPSGASDPQTIVLALSETPTPPAPARPRPEPKAVVQTVLPAAAPAPVEAQAQAKAPDEVLLFESGTWWISGSGRRELEATAARLRSGSYAIEVEGHADSAGPALLNHRISEARARAVASTLEQLGIDPARITVRAYGEQRPSTSGDDRRVELRVRGER